MIKYYRAYFIYLIIAAYFAVILVLSLLPGDGRVYGSLTLIDKVKHILAYAGGAILLETLYLNKRKRFSLLVLLFILSGVIELIQPFVGRSASWLDLVANGIGLTIGWLLIQTLNHGRPR